MSVWTDNNDDYLHTQYKVTKKYSHWLEKKIFGKTASNVYQHY